MEISVHSTTKALLSSGTDVGDVSESGDVPAHPNGFLSGEVKASDHSNLGRPCLQRAHFIYRGIVMMEQV